MQPGNPFDAVVLISFGGPQGPADIRPFLANVVRGRPVPPARIEEVAHHYELFGGVSPITDLTMKQADGLRARLVDAGTPMPVYVGMRNWHPLLPDTIADMSRDGVKRAVGFILAPHGSYSSCQQYKENVRAARRATIDAGLADVEVTYAQGWHTHDLFVETNVQHVHDAVAALPPHLASSARLIFTAHSIPSGLAQASRYHEQLLESARKVAERAGRSDWTLVYQSRSGRPQDPWLGPDICDYLRNARAGGLEAVVLCPIGFVHDHVEVLYDLDREAATVARELGIALTRAATANDHPLFLDMMADVVQGTIRRYATGRPLPFAF